MVYYLVRKHTLLDRILSQLKPLHTHKPCFFKYCSVICLFMFLSAKRCLPFRVSDKCLLSVVSVLRIIRTCFDRLVFIDLIIEIVFTEEYIYKVHLYVMRSEWQQVFPECSVPWASTWEQFYCLTVVQFQSFSFPFLYFTKSTETEPPWAHPANAFVSLLMLIQLGCHV